MDSTKAVILPTMVFCTLVFIIYYRFYSRKSKKKQEQSQDQNQPEVKEKKKDDNIIQNKESEENEQHEIEEKEEEEEPEEKEEEISNWKMTSNMLFDKFCEYIQKNKLVSIDAMAEKLHKNKEDTIKFLRELEKEGKTQGFLGEDGEYFFLTMKELELLNNLLIKSKKKRISEEELKKQFDEIIKERDDLFI